MLIKKDINKCICMKNSRKSCNIQCIYSIYNNNRCKRHQNNRFNTIDNYNLSIIQAYIKSYLIRQKLYKLYGPAYKKPILSHDNIDPISLEQIWNLVDNKRVNVCEIPRYLIFSYIDENKHIRVFNILSLLKLIQYDKKDPTTRSSITSNVIDSVNKRIEYMKKHNIWNNKLVEVDNYTSKQLILNSITNITAFLATENIFIDNSIILNLSEFKIKQLYNECRLILYHNDNKNYTNKLSRLYFQNYNTLINLKIMLDELNDLIKNTLLNVNQYKSYLSRILLAAFMYVSTEINILYRNSIDLM